MSTETETRVLTIQEAVSIATIVGFAQSTSHIAWVGENSAILHGTARSIGAMNGNFLGEGEDVRDAHFRITTDMGFELFMPMRDAIELVGRSFMVRED